MTAKPTQSKERFACSWSALVHSRTFKGSGFLWLGEPLKANDVFVIFASFAKIHNRNKNIH